MFKYQSLITAPWLLTGGEKEALEAALGQSGLSHAFKVGDSFSFDCSLLLQLCEHTMASFGTAASCYFFGDLNQGDVDQGRDSQICYPE